jgi:hypothetical protein
MARSVSRSVTRSLARVLAGSVAGAALSLVFSSMSALPSTVTFTRASLATMYDATGKLTYAPNNLALQSGFAGAVSGTPGTAPTSWAYASSGGTTTVTTDGASGGNRIRLSATAARQMINQTISGLTVSTKYIFSVVVDVITTAQYREFFVVQTFPTNATVAYFLDGVAATVTNSPSTGVHTLHAVITTTDTAGSTNIRLGVGCTGVATGEAIFDAPQLETVTYETARRTYNATTTAAYNGPRLDYDPASVGANLALQTEDFTSTSNWVKANAGTGSAPTVTANQAVAPNGTLTADKWTFALNGGVTSSDQSSFQQQVSATNGVTYTSSIWARADTPCWLAFRNPSNSGTYQSIYVGTGWQRFSISGAPSAGNAVLGVGLRNASGTVLISDSATVYLWGGQIELGTSAKAYSPTTSAAAFGASGVSPSIATARGLLVEEARTNLCLRSAEFDNASWTVSNVTVTPDAGVSPDGTSNAESLVEAATSSQHLIAQSITYADATTYTASVYAKAGTTSRLQLTFGTGAFSGGGYANYNLDTGAVVATGGTVTSSGIESVGNGWYRCKITVLSTAAAAANFQIGLINADADTRLPTYLGTSRTLLLYGAQVEAGAFATSYIPTTTASATRAIDLPTNAFAHDAAVPITIYAKATPRGVVGVTAVIASLDDGTSSNRHTVYNSAASARAQITITGSVTQANLSGGTPAIGTSQKSAMSAKLDDVGFAQTGTAATRDTSSNTMPPGLTTLRIGHAVAGATPFNGHIEEIRIYRDDNTNAELQALTA